MTSKKTAPRKSDTKRKKLTLRREKVADLSPKANQADGLRGQSLRAGGGFGNHNETFVRAARGR